MLLFSSVTTASSVILRVKPRPLQQSQAPYGALNENILGSISSRPTPCSGHENLVEYVTRVSFCSAKILPSGAAPPAADPAEAVSDASFLGMKITLQIPSPSLMAISRASAIRLLLSSLITILSTTISIVCLLFLARVISSSSRRFISPSTLTLVKPSRLILSKIALCSPLRPLMTGASTMILVPTP